MKAVEPIFLIDLFADVHDQLLRLLRGLSDDDWQRPTVAGSWTVKDLTAHLLDSDIRRLSFQRDQLEQLRPATPIESYGDLLGFLNQLNADWVLAMRRLSPPVLLEFLAVTGPQVAALLRSLDPFGPAIFGVAWAGEERSANWFDIAREYTEKWHHQQQIRDAVGAPPLTGRRWLFPVLDTFLRGLPHRFREIAAGAGTQILFDITGAAGGQWTLIREPDAWNLYWGSGENPACRVRMDQDTAWRLLTKGLRHEQAVAGVEFGGDQALGQPILGMLAIMG